MKHSTRLAVALACTAALAAPLQAADSVKDYPNRPLRMIVPNAPGSSVDTLTRIVGNGLTEVVGQQVVMDNRAGAGGIIGMQIAKSANADGYTVIAATTAASTVAVHLQKNPGFDVLKDYEFVVQFGVTPNILVVNPSIPVKTVKELIEYAKGKQGKINMASAGVGSQSHLSGAYFLQAAKFESLHVPYKGGGPSTAAVVANESQWTLVPAAAGMNYVLSGRMRALGHSLPKPSPLMPNIPPIAETVPGFDYSGWMGFFAPKGTPRPILKKLEEAVAKTVQRPDVKKALEVQATEIVIAGPAEFRKVVADSLRKNGELVKSLGLTAN